MMLKDLVTPARVPSPEPKTCSSCCDYELTVQRLREAYELLVEAMAAADRKRTK
jgi:hypothetical protein